MTPMTTMTSMVHMIRMIRLIRSTPPASIVIAAAVLSAGGAARADTVSTGESSIPLRGCVIQEIKLGRVYFRDRSGRRQWREIEQVVALGFDGFEELDVAERVLAAGERTAGLHALLRALLAADTEVETLWARVRLVRVHDARGEYVQAAAHAAAVFLLRDESYWRHLEPTSAPNEPGYAAAEEAMELLERAQGVVTNPELRPVVDRLVATVGPIRDALAATHHGPARGVGSTVSGFDLEAVRRGTVAVAGQDSPNRPPSARETRVPPVGGDGAIDGPAAIDALLAAGRSAEALARCERAARNPGGRSLSRLLYQYGRCLQVEGRPHDAAVMFMRCALLYESSPFAGPSLLEAAVVHRDVFGDSGAARRLAERALDR